MSLAALIWSTQLPLDLGMAGSEAAYRVLTKLADAHHEDTGYAYRDVDRMATELRCSRRTIQRALRQLEQAGLIHRGDQGILPANMRRDRRPTVYRLPLGAWEGPAQQPELDGVTTDDAPLQAVDNLPRGDRHAVDGVTAAVALGTGELGNRYPAQPQTRTLAPMYPCTDGTQRHEFSRRTGQCVYCQQIKPREAIA